MGKIISLSPGKYIKTKGRTLPFHECYITRQWKESGIANIIVSRKQPSGNIVYAVFLADVYCLGIKYAHWEFNISPEEFHEMVHSISESADEMEPCEYILAHNIIYESIAYARDCGFEPHKEFSIAGHLLEDDTENIPYIEIEMGKNGKPLLILTEDENEEPYLKRLNAVVGEGNYEVLFVPDLDDPEYDPDNEQDFEKDGDDDSDDMENEFRDEMEEFYKMIDLVYEENFKSPGVSFNPETMAKVECEISFEPMGNEGCPVGVKEAEDLYRMVFDSPKKAIDRLERLTKQYPGYPLFYNHLMCAYQNAGKSLKAEQLILETYRKFPDYLFAKTVLAGKHMRDGKISKIPELFNHKYELTSLYPERKEFHYTEACTFYATMVRYFTAIGQLHQASVYMNLIDEIVQDEAHPLIELAANELREKKLDEIMKSNMLDKANDRMNILMAKGKKELL